MTNIVILIVSFHHMICYTFISHNLSHQLIAAHKVLTFQLVIMRNGAAEKQFHALTMHRVLSQSSYTLRYGYV